MDFCKSKLTENTVLVGEKVYFIRYENVCYGLVFETESLSKHFLSLPFYAFLGRDIKQGFSSLSSPQSTTSTVASFTVLVGNLITQLACASGVNRLTSVREFLNFIFYGTLIYSWC